MKKILLTVLSALAVGAQPLTACGPHLDIDETRYALFRNGLNGYEGLEAFYYTENFLNNNISDPQGLDYRRNCEEWRRYAGDADMNIEHIYAIQYETEPEVFLDAYRRNDWSAFRKNGFIKWLTHPRRKRAMAYMVLAKEAEQTQFGSEDIWSADIGSPQRDSAIRAVAEKSLSMARKTKDNFLKERYAFQAVKMAYYASFTRENGSAVPYMEAYEKYIRNGNSVVKGWAVYFCGLMEPVNSEAYVSRLLRAFDWSEEKKVPVYNQLYNIKEEVYAAGKKDPSLQEASLVVFGAMTFGRNLQQVRQIYSINPESKYLPFLISREINKVENWIWSYDLLKFNNLNEDLTINTSYGTNRKNDYTYLDDLLAFIEKAEAEGKTDPLFTRLALVHLLNLKGRYADAGKVLARLSVPASSRYHDQFLIERVIVTAKTENILVNDTKLRLAADLQLLKDQQDAVIKKKAPYWADELSPEEMDDMQELMVFLSYCYKERGDIVTAGLLRQKANVPSNEYGYMQWSYWYYQEEEPEARGINTANDYYSIAYFDKHAAVEDVYNLIMFKHKQQKNKFEQLLEPVKWADDDMFYDLIGTKYLREQQYEMALQVFEKMDPAFWETQYAYKEYLPSRSIFDLGTYAPWDLRAYAAYPATSKVAVLRDIVKVNRELEMPALKPARKAELLRLLGNARLNMTYNGHFWMMISYGKYDKETYEEKDDIFRYTFYPNTIKYGADYYRNSLAVETFRQALQLAPDKESKAEMFLDLCLAEHLAVNAPYPQRELPGNIAATRVFNIARTTCPDLDSRFK